MQNLHYIQLSILRELLFKKEASFSELNVEQLTTDQFAFHLKQLVRFDFISKNEVGKYLLTPSGLEIAGRIDVESGTLFNQPKVSISLGILKEEDGKQMVLLSKRKKNQSAGQIAWHTQKVKLGESLYDTCKSCLKNEAGLTADFIYAGTTHIIRKHEDKFEIDVVLIDFKAINITGDLITENEEQTNFWISFEEALKLEDTVVGFKERLNAYKDNKVIFQEFIREIK